MRAVVFLRGSARDYLFYVAIVGAYGGPGTYPLWPWTHADLSAPDGIAKIAVREVDTGALWQSGNGSLSVSTDGRSGSLDADLGYAGRMTPPPPGILNISGRWACEATPSRPAR